MNRENNYLEEFLLSAQEKIDDLSVSFEPRDTDDYKYLVVDFEKTTYKISRELVFNFCNIYHKLNRDDSEEVEEEVNPYKNLGSIKEKKLIIESNIIQSEDGVSELLEKIISKIYEKYNFLILPANDEEVEEIIVEDYIKSPYESHTEQAKSQGQNLYSIGFKIKVERENQTEYIPFKVYFRLDEISEGNNKGQAQVKIAEEFNSLEKANKINVLTARKFTQKEKASLKKKFENHEFVDDKERISANIEPIIYQVLSQIEAYVSDFSNSPSWFKDSELGKYIQNALFISDNPDIHATANFRYITQTPLPYSFVSVRFRNLFGSDVYEIKKSSNNKLNDSLNTCPICGEVINEKNKIVASNEYVQNFLGCQKCMTIKCSECDSVWSEKKAPTPINRKVGGKYYYKAGACDSIDFVDYKYLCSQHAKRCFNTSCNGKVYSSYDIVKCSNVDCERSYCKEHADIDLYKCETSICKNSEFPNRYCSECKDRFLNTCSFCGKTMCQSCSREILIQNDLGNFEPATNEFICLDCLSYLTNGENLEVNKKNKAIVKGDDDKYYPKSQKYLKKYGEGTENQFIDNSIALLAYTKRKPENWKEDLEDGKFYYREDEVKKCSLCEQYFKYTRTLKFDKRKQYCDDCLVTCDMCEETVVKTDAIKYDGLNYCKNCIGKNWDISDLNMDNVPFTEDKESIIKMIFNNMELAKDYKVVPVAKKDLFVCPETELKVKENQTKVCKSCGQRYALSNYLSNRDTCKLCDSLNDFDYNQDKDVLLKAFYNKSFGQKDKFKAYCTKNTLVISYQNGKDKKISIYLFDKKKGKYRFKESLTLGEKEVASDAE